MVESQGESTLVTDEIMCAIERPILRWPDFERPPKPELAAEGWTRRFMANGDRLEEYVNLYQSLGYEVRAESVGPDEIGPECADCRLVLCRQFVTIYTRPKG